MEWNELSYNRFDGKRNDECDMGECWTISEYYRYMSMEDKCDYMDMEMTLCGVAR